MALLVYCLASTGSITMLQTVVYSRVAWCGCPLGVCAVSGLHCNGVGKHACSSWTWQCTRLGCLQGQQPVGSDQVSLSKVPLWRESTNAYDDIVWSTTLCPGAHDLCSLNGRGTTAQRVFGPQSGSALRLAGHSGRHD